MSDTTTENPNSNGLCARRTLLAMLVNAEAESIDAERPATDVQPPPDSTRIIRQAFERARLVVELSVLPQKPNVRRTERKPSRRFAR